jgi:fermentation-respiration switch protein FrsA (DUF1100 family)
MTEWRDVKAANDYLAAIDPNLPTVAFGVSMGGATVLVAFGEVQEIDAVISLSAYTNFADEFSFQMEEMRGSPRWLAQAEKPFAWLYLGIKHGFGNLKYNPLVEVTKANGRPMLMMHSTEDSTVSYEFYEELAAAAPEAEYFLRQGDYHMIVYEDVSLTPQEDTLYAEAILEFLDGHFANAESEE